MAEDEGGDDRPFEATPRRLEAARARGDVPVSREGSSAGLLIAALLTIALAGGSIAHRFVEALVPLLQNPAGLADATAEGYRGLAGRLGSAIALVIAPFFVFVLVAALVPHALLGGIVLAPERIRPDPGKLSPRQGLQRIFSARAWFEFAKNMAKMLAVAAACYAVVRPFYDQAAGLVVVDPAAFPLLLRNALTSLLLAISLVAGAVTAIDVPYQHWSYRRRLRMSRHEMREEMRATEGDPQIKARLSKLRRLRRRRRMMADVPLSSVVIVNPTHFAVALRYRRGIDAAPVVVAKGVDLAAMRIREIAGWHKIPIVEDALLARALHTAVDIGEMIPREHFEAVARVIAVILGQKRARDPVQVARQGGRPRA
jgi:flagellar biosynthetic protein FlhB